MHWNFGRWNASLNWPGLVAWLIHLLHKLGEHGSPWEVFALLNP